MADSQAEKTWSRPDAIGMQMMTALEGTAWYLTFLEATKGRRGGGNAVGVGAGVGRGMGERIGDADVRGHRLQERGTGEVVKEISALRNGMTVIASHICVPVSIRTIVGFPVF